MLFFSVGLETYFFQFLEQVECEEPLEIVERQLIDLLAAIFAEVHFHKSNTRRGSTEANPRAGAVP
jgi:hypothetical protein